MRATKAYIASLGTTGVLLAASVLMLAVVSAVVAFDRWPGGSVSNPVQTLVLNEKPAAIRVSESSNAPSLTAAPVRAVGVALRTSAPGPRAVGRAPAGALLGERPRAGAPAAPGVPGVQVPKPVQDVQNSAAPLFDAVSNPGTTASQVADGVQSVTDATGGGLAPVSPSAGQTVTQTGAGVATAVRQLPLPQHVLPGY